MSPKYILLCTLMGFPIVYFVPYGGYLLTTAWVLYSLITMGLEYLKNYKWTNVVICYMYLDKLLDKDSNKVMLWADTYNDSLREVPFTLLRTVVGSYKVKKYLQSLEEGTKSF